jgi:outer membrane receptor protein involved in Fe transport
VQGSYAVGSLSATLSGADDKAQLRLFVNNVTNELYRQNATYLGAMGAYYGNYAPPRTFGASISYRY